jgi:hypothetical protein
MTSLSPDSILIPYRSFTLEIQSACASAYPQRLDAIREEVLSIAALSRGWERPEDLESFRHVFKLGPLFETNSLVLIRRDGRLVGLAGSVNNWSVEAGSIVHLCSVGLLPEAQGRGFIPSLMRLLWLLNFQDEDLRRNYRAGRVFVSAITQSPYLLAMLDHLFAIFPSPRRMQPDPVEVAVAHAVVDRFDPNLTLEDKTFVLRDECQFFYRKWPRSTNREWNAYCQHALRFSAGDVFVAVGRATPDRLEPFCRDVETRYPELAAVLDSVLAVPVLQR